MKMDERRARTSGSSHAGAQAAVRVPLTIRTIDDLNIFLRASQLSQPLPKEHLTFTVPGFTEQERLKIQRKLNAHAHACGCSEGAVFALTVIAVAIAYAIFSVLHGTRFHLIVVLLATLILIPLCGGIGKLAGKFVARIRFRWMCERLIRSRQPDSPQENSDALHTKMENKL